MISVNNICVSFSGKDLFSDISFVINPRDRIGLIGKNGVGKSTLLKIICKEIEADKGNVAVSEGRTMGYLPQEISTDESKTVHEEMLSAFEEVQRIENDIHKISEQLETRQDYESEAYSKLIEKLTEKHEQLNLLGIAKIEGNVNKILKGLGFAEADFHRPMGEFSGGWQMRVELGKLLLQKPDLLLLDEPTNHLDIESILWLESYFQEYDGAIILISHDKLFLDNVTNRTIELVFGKVYDYKVPYSKYFELREERMETQLATFKNQQKQIDQQERFIERFKAKASKAKQVQSRQKLLDKIERVEIDEIDTQSIQFRFPPAPRSGDVVLKVKELVKYYDQKQIFKDVTLEVERGEKVAFVGKNGMGKSTLVKIITENLEHQGEIKIGHNVFLGYYAQIQENTLEKSKTVLETIESHVTTEEWANITRIRGLLGAFLFRDDDVYKQVKVLSGGEKSRLALATLLLTPTNLLILDEPTNHLDIASKEILKSALKNYEGAMLVVSHDRDFLKGLTSKTYEFVDGIVRQHIGDIDDFLSKHKTDNFRAFETKDIAPKKPKAQAKKNPPKSNDNETRALKKEIAGLEKKIQSLEDEIKTLEKEIEQMDSYTEDSNKLLYQHKDLKVNLERSLSKWEDLQTQLEKFV